MRTHARFPRRRVALGALLLCLLYPPPLRALEITDPIDVDTVWSPVDNPHEITSNVTVLSGVTLTLEPGVDVQIAEGFSLLVEGTLLAPGVSYSPIVFSNHPSSGTGGGLRIVGSDAASPAAAELTYCRLSALRGQTAPFAALHTQHAVLNMTNCVIRDLPSGALRPLDSRISIVHNVITNTAEAINAVRCAGVIASNSISRINGYADAIDLDFAWTGPGDNTMLLLRNTLADAADPDADGIDFGTSPGVAQGNIIRNFGDKGISIGERSPATVYNNLVIGCTMGVAIKDGSAPDLQNNTIVNCAYGIRSYEKNRGMGGGRGSLTNSIVWGCGTGISLENGSTLEVSHGCIQGATVWPGERNTNLDPEFREPARDNFRLLPGSPCINAGTNQPWMTGFVDLDGDERIQHGVVDIGCYEFETNGLACNFIGTPRIGELPLDVVFTAYAAGTNLDGLAYAWDLDGDGTNEPGAAGLAVVTSRYERMGRYTVSLTVSNSAAESVTLTKTNYLTARGPQAVYVVPAGSEPDFPFDTWETAATNIQQAVDAGFEGTTVWVTDGVYAVSAPIVIRENVAVRGVNGREATAVDGQDLTACFTLAHTGAVVEGFTITRGRALNGAGVFLDGAGTVRDCILRDNHATYRGGGAFCNSGGRLNDCLLDANVADDRGGGVYFSKGGEAERCTFTSNAVTGGNGDGGAAHCQTGGLLRNCLLTGNSAADRGGGAFCESGGTLESCTVVGNSARYGGGVRFYSGGTLLNSIVYFNEAATPTNDPNCCIGGAAPSISYTCTMPLPAGAGNLDADPALLDRDSGNYRLGRGSPCRDAGLNDPRWMTDGTDLDGARRLVNATVDLGAFEAGYLGCRFTVSPASGAVPLETEFSGAADGTNTAGLSYAWDFDGDGTNEAAGAALVFVRHTYTNYGRYSVALTVSNAAGETAVARSADCVLAIPGVLYVAGDGSHDPPYGSWETAATNIQPAVDAAAEGTVILVATGTYLLDAPILLTKGVAVRAWGPAPATVLDGRNAVRCLYVEHADAVLDGFTVTGGRTVTGGGIYFAGAGLAQNCTIFSNAATARGGGVFFDRGGTLRRSDVIGNRVVSGTDDGGGVYCNSGGTVEQCRVIGNRSRDDGGGIQCNYGGTVRDTLIQNNTAPDKGGGVFCWPGGYVENCLIVSNSAGQGGGAAFRNGGLVVHCTIATNRATIAGGGLYSFDGGTSLNTVIYFNVAPADPDYRNEGLAHHYAHCCSLPAPDGEGNRSGPPLFTDVRGGDFHLQAGSACVDGGAAAGAPRLDFDGMPRPLDGDGSGTSEPDIGAFERLVPEADSDADQMPDGWEIEHGLDPTDPDGNQGGEADLDGDGLRNAGEFAADTDPRDATSRLIITALSAGEGGLRMEWSGGSNAWQYIEAGENLRSTGEAWTRLLTNEPPTPLTNSWTATPAEGTSVFYRIRAGR